MDDGYNSDSWNPRVGTLVTMNMLRRNQVVEFWYRGTWWPGTIRFLNHQNQRCYIQVLLSEQIVRTIPPKHIRHCRFDLQ